MSHIGSARLKYSIAPYVYSVQQSVPLLLGKPSRAEDNLQPVALYLLQFPDTHIVDYQQLKAIDYKTVERGYHDLFSL